MKRLTLVALVALLGACSGSEQPSAGTGTSSSTVPSTSTTAAVPSDSFAARPDCVAGESSCVTAVLDELRRRYEPLEAACDHNALFALAYIETTETVAESVDSEGVFEDPRWIRRLDAVFADLYFGARDAWEEGREDDVPGVWRTAFGAADARQVAGIGDTMLGMIAHISRDLAVALSTVGLEAEDGTSHEADFKAVDPLFLELAPEVIAGGAERFDPTMASFSIPGLNLDENTFGAVIASWRQEAWDNAQRLVAAAGDAEHDQVLDQIEANAQARSLLVQTATTYLPLTGAAEARDDYCEQSAG